MKKLNLCLYLILFIGCYSSTMQQKANTAAINYQILTEEELHFITRNQCEYKLNVTYIDDKILRGSGQLKQTENSGWEEFNGDVVIDSIDFLHFSKTDFGKSLLINGTILTLLVKAMMAWEGPDNPTIEFVYPPSGSSCPFIYSSQEDEYRLEGEAFAIALGKAREMTTATVLSLPHNWQSEVKLRITNERPETHFINQVALEAFLVDKKASICADNQQNIWPVYHSIMPEQAVAEHETDIWKDISVRDNRYWQSIFKQNAGYSDFQDEIELVFKRPDAVNEGSLLIHAINTYFGNYAFEEIFRFLGDQSLAFMQQIENDRESIRLMEKWARESALKAYIRDGSDWHYCGMIFPEANVVPFSRLIRIKIPPESGERIHIKLTSLADVWKIDAVQMDWTPVHRIDGQSVPLISADGPFIGNAANLIAKKDEKYAVLLPAQKIDLRFSHLPVLKNKKYLYALRVGGYLYEWLPLKSGNAHFLSTKPITEMNKVALVKNLLQHRQLLLPLIYSGWKSER